MSNVYAELTEATNTIREQAEEIRELQTEIKRISGTEFNSYARALFNENKRLKAYILERSNWTEEIDFCVLKQDVKSPHHYQYYLVRTDAAQPQKG